MTTEENKKLVLEHYESFVLDFGVIFIEKPNRMRKMPGAAEIVAAEPR
jgi:hypothetical protein